MISIVPVFMFATPIFYSIDDVPPASALYAASQSDRQLCRDDPRHCSCSTDCRTSSSISATSSVSLRSCSSSAIVSSCNTRPCSSMSSDLVISCDGVGKAFQLYLRRNDQLKQAIFRALEAILPRALGAARRQLQGASRRKCRDHRPQRRRQNDAVADHLRHHAARRKGQCDVNGRIAPILALGAGFDHAADGPRKCPDRRRHSRHAPLARSRRGSTRIAAFADIGDFFDQPMQTLFDRHGGAARFRRLRPCRRRYPDRRRGPLGRRRSLQRQMRRLHQGFREARARFSSSRTTSKLWRRSATACIWIEDGVVRGVGPAPAVICLLSRSD